MGVPSGDDPLLPFEALIERLVTLPSSSTVGEKISALERLIEQWRVSRHVLVNKLEYERFLHWQWFVDADHLHFAPRMGGIAQGSGTQPIQLQRKLLVFLLLQHGQTHRILELIEAFIAKIRPSLSLLDFKKTETGVFRCFTNTRFAANRLREFGLLKFTHREAFKTWTLSLSGFLVAAQALTDFDWSIPQVHKVVAHDLDPFILNCCHNVADYPTFVKTLGKICAPNVKIFETFEPVLKVSHTLLQEYWGVLQDTEKAKSDRAKLSRELIDRLDDTLGYGEFLRELALCIQIEDALKNAEEAAGNPSRD